MKDILKKSGISSIIVAIVFAILGIIMLAHPEGVEKTITTILAIIVLLIGVEKIISYFAFKGNGDLYNYEFLIGIVAILLSIAMFIYSEIFTTISRVIIGIWIAYEGIMKMGISLKLKGVGVNFWIPMLILSLITLIAGLYIICNKSTIIVATAVIMIVYSVIEIIDETIFMKNVDKLL